MKENRMALCVCRGNIPEPPETQEEVRRDGRTNEVRPLAGGAVRGRRPYVAPAISRLQAPPRAPAPRRTAAPASGPVAVKGVRFESTLRHINKERVCVASTQTLFRSKSDNITSACLYSYYRCRRSRRRAWPGVRL